MPLSTVLLLVCIGSMLYSREPSIPAEEEETVIEEDDTRDEDIVERWKKGRFRPQVDSRRPTRGFDRARQRFGRGRGRFGGSFYRNTTDNRPQEGRTDGIRRERQRSGSAEIHRQRLPGRFDRQRSRSDSRERQRHRSRDRETRKSDVDLSGHKDTKENKSNHIYRRRSRERYESKVSRDESKPSVPLHSRRSDDRTRDAPKRRWDQRAGSKEKGRQAMKEIQDVKTKKNAVVAAEEQSQVESVAKEIRGRWERDESSEEESVEAKKEVDESSTVDAFGRDISKRHEYKLKQKHVGSQYSGLVHSDDRVTRYNRIDNDRKQKVDDVSRTPAVDVVSERRKERNSIGDDELSTQGVSDGKDDEDNVDDSGDKFSKVKGGKKKKHKKKAPKRSKHQESDAEDDVAGNLKDTDVTEEQRYMDESNTRLKQTYTESNGSREEMDQNTAVVLDGLHAESEMRERIKLKMKQRMEGSLLKKNILTPDEISDEKGNDLQDLKGRFPEKGKDKSHADEKLQEPDGVSQTFSSLKLAGSIRLTDSKKQIVERARYSESDSGHDARRKSSGSGNKKQRETESKDRETLSRKERQRRKFRDDSYSSVENRMRKGRRSRRDSIEENSGSGARESRRNSRKTNKRDHYSKTAHNKEYTGREIGKSKRGARHRSDSYSSSDTETEKNLKGHSDTSSDSGRARRKKATKAKERTDFVDSRKKLEKGSKVRGSRARSDSGSSGGLEEAAGAKQRHKVELDSVPRYEAKTSRISEGGTVRSAKEHFITTKKKRRTYSSEKSSTTDSEDDINTKRTSRKKNSDSKFSKKSEEKSRRKAEHRVNSSSDEESSDEDKGDKKKHYTERSSRISEFKRRASREQLSRRRDDAVSPEDEKNKYTRRDAKERMKEHKERIKKSDSEESDTYSSDSSEDLRKENRRQFKSNKNQRGDSSPEEADKEKARTRKRSEKHDKHSRDISSTEYKGKEVKEDDRKRKKKRRESSEVEELLKNKRRKRRFKHNESDDEYEMRGSKKKHKVRDRSEKHKRSKRHVTNSEDSDHARMEKNVETKRDKYGKGHSETKSDRVASETLEKSGNLFESRFRKGKDRDSADEDQSADGVEGKTAEQSKGLEDTMESRNSNSAAREETQYVDVLGRMHGMRDASNVDLHGETYSEERQKILDSNIVEKLEDARHFDAVDLGQEAKATRDNDSSSDISLYGDIDLKNVSSHGLLSRARSDKGTSRRKVSKIASHRDSASPTDSSTGKDRVSGNTVKRKQDSRPEYSRGNRSVSRDDGSRREQRGREMRRSGSESSDDSTYREGKSAGRIAKRTKSPISRSRSGRGRRSNSRDSSSSRGKRKTSHHRRRKTSSESASDSDDVYKHGKTSKGSGTKRGKSRSRSPQHSSRSSYSSSVDDEKRRDGVQSKKRKGHTRDSYRRSRKSSEDSHTSMSSVDKRKRKRK